MKDKLSNFVIAFFLVIIVAFNVIAVFWVNQMVSSELEVSAKNTLRDLAEDEKRSINLIVKGKEESLYGLAELISQTGHNVEDLYSHMERWREYYGMETIFIVYNNGFGISSMREHIDISNEPYFNQALDGNIHISGVYTSTFSKKDVMVATAPIYYDSIFQGVLVAEYTVEYLTGLLMDSTDSRGSSMIVNSQGHILMHTYPFPVTFDNFKAATFEEGKTHSGVLNDFLTSTEGSVTFSIGGERKLGEYIPLGIDDWSLFFEISEIELTESANRITNSMIIISICLGLSFVFFMYYILRIRRKSLLEVEKVAYYDKLTGLPNLIKFKIDVEQLLLKNGFDPTGYGVIKCDLENFKAINEVFGFEVGNKVIRTIANYIKHIEGTIVKSARTGTDEFIIFAGREVLRKHLEQRILFNSLIENEVPEIGKHQFFFRYGRYYLEKKEKNIDDIVNKVSMAHSFAKVEGGSVIWDYDDTFKLHLVRTTELTNKMHTSLKNKDFKVFLQPKFSLSDNIIVGAESLVRWIEPDGTMIFPNDFIPLFEKNEFIIELDKYMFENTCALLQKWKSKGKPLIPISVNFSRVHLRNPYFVRELKKIADRYEVATKYLEIELTETSIIENYDNLSIILHELKSAGFAVSIDDFGSGYSSLGMLKDYKVDIVKLDRSFLTGENEGRLAQVVIEGIVTLVHNLGTKVVAEGIETTEQLEFLRETGCYAAQGYIFAKPMSIEDFEKQNGYL